MASFGPNGLEDVFFDTFERAESRGLAPPSAAVPVPNYNGSMVAAKVFVIDAG